MKLKEFALRLLGERIASYLLKEWEDRKIDLKKAKVAASPNLIHSLDAAFATYGIRELGTPLHGNP
jgi:DNA-directed RNA polymerase